MKCMKTVCKVRKKFEVRKDEDNVDEIGVKDHFKMSRKFLMELCNRRVTAKGSFILSVREEMSRSSRNMV